jgi:hypothetical protein
MVGQVWEVSRNTFDCMVRRLALWWKRRRDLGGDLSRCCWRDWCPNYLTAAGDFNMYAIFRDGFAVFAVLLFSAHPGCQVLASSVSPCASTLSIELLFLIAVYVCVRRRLDRLLTKPRQKYIWSQLKYRKSIFDAKGFFGATGIGWELLADS